jgi:predicted phosphoadenosine phosphosulfate sulfurtransferase
VPFERVFKHFEEWEETAAGLWRRPIGIEREHLIARCARFMANTEAFCEAMLRAIEEWPNSCEVSFTNPSLNQQAWLGHAACCIAIGCPEEPTRAAWWTLTQKQRDLADEAAAKVIQIWTVRYERQLKNKRPMPKRPLGIDVLTATRERIAWTFDRYERLSVSFSGGKDSTVMLHLVMDEAKKRNRKVGILFIDLEGQYTLTIEHIKRCLALYADYIEPYWICLPIHLRNAVSVYETHWTCWDAEKKPAWIRDLPDGCISDVSYFPFFHPNMEFEEFDVLFGEWYSQGKPCACFVGIRSDESLNRYRTIASPYKATIEGKKWTTEIRPNLVNIYPIYDWRTQDLWIYQGRNPDRPSNELYDLMWKAGLTIHQMRICQPYGDDQRRGLWLFHLIDPDTWARVVARVNGANSGALYVQESGNITGYRRVSKPPQHNWRSFAALLIKSMPPKTREHYENKVAVFRKWWMERGYPEGIPDEAPYDLEAARKAPSWRRVCKMMLRNDYWAKGLGFSQHKSEAYEKYLDLMRRRKEQWKLESIEQ